MRWWSSTPAPETTREIAQACGTRVFEFPWCDAFSAARNAGLDQARSRNVLWIDADDVVPPETGRAFRELGAREEPAAYHVAVRIPPGPGEYSPQVVDHVKFFPNRPDLRFEHRIHEQILPSLRRAELPVYSTDLYVVHRNYDRSPEGQAKKRLRDFRLLELDLRSIRTIRSCSSTSA